MNNNLMEQEERKRASFLERLQIFTDVRNSVTIQVPGHE